MDPSIASFRVALDARPISGVQCRLVGMTPLVRFSDGDDSDIVAYVVTILGWLSHVRSLAFRAVSGTGVIGPIADGVLSGINVTYKEILFTIGLVILRKQHVTLEEPQDTFRKQYAIIDMTCVARAPTAETPIPENPIPWK